MEQISYFDTEIGLLGVSGDEGGITGIYFEGAAPDRLPEGDSELLQRARRQLCEYLCGERKQFDLPLSPKGTPFQQSVWKALCEIPYGETRTYGEVAKAVGNPKACRAVGLANNRNPLPLVVPCHRVVGASGKLVGYAGGLDLKARLLQLEKTE